MNTYTYIVRPDGSRARQFADHTWLVEHPAGTWHIEAPDLPPINVPATKVHEATFSIHGLVTALVWHEHRRRSLPEEADEPWAVALAVALRRVA